MKVTTFTEYFVELAKFTLSLLFVNPYPGLILFLQSGWFISSFHPVWYIWLDDVVVSQ